MDIMEVQANGCLTDLWMLCKLTNIIIEIQVGMEIQVNCATKAMTELFYAVKIFYLSAHLRPKVHPKSCNKTLNILLAQVFQV